MYIIERNASMGRSRLLQPLRFSLDLSRSKRVPSQWQTENAEDYWWVVLNSKPFSLNLVEQKNWRGGTLRAVYLEETNFKPLV